MSDSRIMKRHTTAPSGGPVVFNFEDVRKRGEDYKLQVREQCRQMILDATAEAETLREKALAEGLREGRENGLRNARQEIEEQGRKLADQLVQQKLQSALSSMQSLFQQLNAAGQQCRAEWECDLVRLSAAIAGKIMRIELSHHPERVLELVQDVVELVIGRRSIELRLNPQDMDSFGARLQQMVEENTHGAAVRLTADELVTPGGCLVRTEHGEVDGRLETMLDRITEELLDGVE